MYIYFRHEYVIETIRRDATGHGFMSGPIKDSRQISVRLSLDLVVGLLDVLKNKQ